MTDLARAHALATSIKALATGPALAGLAAELLDVLARVSVAAAGADAVEPTPPVTAAASPEVIAPPPPSSGASRALSQSPDAVRARERRAEQRRLAELAATGQLELPNVRRRRSLGRDDRPTTVASLSTLTDLDQSDQREAGRRRAVATVALDHTTPLDDELLGIASGEMSRRGVVFDITTAWTSFIAEHVENDLTRRGMLAKWKRWCARERASEPAPTRPVDEPTAGDDVELPLDPDRPPYSLLEAAEGVRSDLPQFVLRHSFWRFAKRHPMHASPAEALAFWLRWVRGEDAERVGPREMGKSGQKSHQPSARDGTASEADGQIARNRQPTCSSVDRDEDDPFALPYPAPASSPATGSPRGACAGGREERVRDPPALAASA